MYLQCIEILAKFRIAKLEIHELPIQNRNEKRLEKIWASLSKKSWGKGKWKYHLDISLEVTVCVRAHKYMYMCVCVFVTADNICDIHITLSYFQSVCNAN